MSVVAITGYNGLYGQDSHEYFRYCGQLRNFLQFHQSPGDFFWPVTYPLGGAILSFATGTQVAMQLLPLLCGAWILVLIASFLMMEFPGREQSVAFYTLIVLGCSPYFFRYAISSMSDVPAMALTFTAWYSIYCFYRKNKHPDLVLAAFATSAAIFTRFALMPLLVPVMYLVVKFYLKKFNLLSFLISLSMVLLPVLTHLYFKQDQAAEIFFHYQLQDWSLFNFFRSDFNTIDGLHKYSLPNIMFVLSFLIHPGYLSIGALLLLIMLVRKQQPSLLNPVLLTGVVLYLLFLAGLPSRSVRLVVPVIPCYIIFCFPSYLSLEAWFRYRKSIKVPVVFALILVQGALVFRAFQPFYQLNREEQYIARDVTRLNPTVVYTFGMDGALKTYGYHGELINLWSAKISHVRKGAVLIFNRKESIAQWDEKFPMINYNFILSTSNYRLIESRESGWEIYEIKG